MNQNHPLIIRLFSNLYTLYQIKAEHGEFQLVVIGGQKGTCKSFIDRCEKALRKEGIKI